MTSEQREAAHYLAQGRVLDPASLHGPVWVIAPHPDDEGLGCGGLTAAVTDLGTEVWAMLVSDGSASHSASVSWSPARLAAERLGEWHAALDVLGVLPERRVSLGLPDSRLPWPEQPGGEAAVHLVELALSRAAPATVLMPWRRDPHSDHRATHALVSQALASWPQARVLEYTVWLPERGEAGDLPRPGEAEQWFTDLPGQQARKEAAIRCHHSQLGLLIHDDPAGFVLPEDMIRRAVSTPERLLEVAR